jgi:hypothetical protein
MELIPSDDEIKMMQVIAQNASKSKFFEKLGGSEGCFCILLMARELGVPLMSALTGGIRYMLGNVEISPRLMNSMIRQRGHRIEIIESTDHKCVLKGVRKDTNETYNCIYSLEEARKAGLVKPNSGWEKYPTDMLFARCISRLARRLFADIIGNAYVQGEISDPEGEEIKPDLKPEELPEATAEILETTIEEWMNRFKEVHGDLYQEDLLKYLLHAKENVPEGKNFESLMQTCLNSPNNFRKSFDKWLERQTKKESAEE